MSNTEDRMRGYCAWKSGNVTRLVAATCVIVAVACSGPESDEPGAARALSKARDVEGDLTRLSDAITAYDEVAKTFHKTDSGKWAAERVTQLKAIVDLMPGYEAAPEDSLPSVSGDILRLAPNYEPVLHRLGAHYAGRSKFYTRAAASFQDSAMTRRLLRVWAFQDSLWSGYEFRATHEDRQMRDMLCQHSLDVARMFEGARDYSRADQIIQRGLDYGSGKDIVSKAKVYGSFYKFRTGSEDEAYRMAGEVLENSDLEDRLKAKAHHVRGLIMTYRYQDHKQVADLDKAIESLNAAVDLDPAIGDARSLLRQLRKTRSKLQAS